MKGGAPVLNTILLAKVGRAIERAVCAKMKYLRYADDYLVVMREVEKTLGQHEMGITLTYELPEESKLQYLDLELYLSRSHTRWQYPLRRQKKLNY